MANNIVANLFGIDPALLEQQREEADNTRAMKMAQLDPMAQAAAPVYAMHSQFGRQLGSLMGVQDPAVQENAKLLAVKKQARDMGLDPTSAQGMMKYAKLLDEAGMSDKAQIAAQKAQEMSKTQAEIDDKTMDANKTKAELLGTVPTEIQRNIVASGAVRGSPEWNAKMREYVDADITNKTKPNVINPLDRGVSQGRIENAFKQEAVLNEGATAASDMKPAVEALLAIAKQPMVGGVAPELKTTLVRIMQDLGVSSETLDKAQTNADLYDSTVTELLLTKASALKPVSDTDMALLQKTVGNRKMSMEAKLTILQRIMKGIDTTIAKKDKYYEGMDKGYAPYNFDFASGNWRAGAPNVPFKTAVKGDSIDRPTAVAGNGVGDAVPKPEKRPIVGSTITTNDYSTLWSANQARFGGNEEAFKKALAKKGFTVK